MGEDKTNQIVYQIIAWNLSDSGIFVYTWIFPALGSIKILKIPTVNEKPLYTDPKEFPMGASKRDCQNGEAIVLEE